jgi:hypothetical protein
MITTVRRIHGAALLVLGASGASAQTRAPNDSVLIRAMRDELTRSISQLRLDTLPKPYFIAYRVSESDGHSAGARLGSLNGTGEGSGSRFFQVELRVGDYAFDNTNYFGAGFLPSEFVGFGELPADDNYQEIRRQIWLATDHAYKQALEALSQKRAALETRSRTDSLADFSREPVTNTTDDVPPATMPSHQTMEALARELSAAFRDAPELYTSSVNVSTSWTRTIYMNSEGTSWTRSRPHASVTASATTQAVDGTGQSMNYPVQASSFAELPSKDSLMTGVKDLIARLTAQRHMPLADAYDGPVLFEGQAAAEVFNAMIAARLVGTRRPVTSATFASLTAGGNDWEDLVGSLVLPRTISVMDDPTLHAVDGKPVDYFKVDEEGVATHPTTIVDHGFLKTLLTTRTPVTGVEHSTGNRFGGGARPVHVIVTADSGLTDEQMRQKLLALASAQGRTYGVVVRQMGTGGGGGDPQAMVMAMMDQQQNRTPAMVRATRAYKVYADGHEEAMRGAEISGVSAAAFKELAGVTQSRTVHTIAFANGGNIFGGGGGSGAVTYQVPSFLFGNLSIRKPRGSTPRLPVVGPPPPEP